MTFESWWASKYGRTADVSEAHYELMREAYCDGRADEREACADICDQHASVEGIAQKCAEAIRGSGDDFER